MVTDPFFPGTADPARAPGDAAGWAQCSGPPGESCSDAGCPVHGWEDEDGDGEPDGTVHVG